MSLSDSVKDLLRGGLPEVLDYGTASNPNAPGTGTNQKIERLAPVGAGTQIFGLDGRVVMVVAGIGVIVLLYVMLKK